MDLIHWEIMAISTAFLGWIAMTSWKFSMVTICFALHFGYYTFVSSFIFHMFWRTRIESMRGICLRRFLPFVETLDYCQFGEDWKKPTTIMGNFWHVPAISRRCTGTHHFCSATYRPHVPLSGRAANGLFRTLLAQPYPWDLAYLVAGTVSRAINNWCFWALASSAPYHQAK